MKMLPRPRPPSWRRRSQSSTATSSEPEREAELKVLGGTSDFAEHTKFLEHLIKEREECQLRKEQVFKVLNEKRIARKDSKLVKNREAAAERQFDSAREIIDLKLQNRKIDAKAEQKKMAAAVNEVLDRLDVDDEAGFRKLCGGDLNAAITSVKYNALRRSIPTGDFQIRFKNGVHEILFNDEVKMVLKAGGKIEKLWLE